MASTSRRGAKKRKPDVPFVPPVVETRALNEEEEVVSFRQTASPEAISAYDNYFSTRKIWLERGIDFTKVGKDLKDIFGNKHLMDFAAERISRINVTMVAEFYSVLSTYDPETIQNVVSVPLRTVDIHFSPEMINAFYGMPEIMEEDDYRTVWRIDDPVNLQFRAFEAQRAFDPTAEWKENRFSYGDCLRDVRAIKQFLSQSVVPTTHVCGYGKEDVVIAWAMVHDMDVNFGRIIYSKALEFSRSRNRNGRLPFPNLISGLCYMNQVPILPGDRIESPYTPPVGVRLSPLNDGPLRFPPPQPHPQQQPQAPPPQQQQQSQASSPPRERPRSSPVRPSPLRTSRQSRMTIHDRFDRMEAMYQHMIQNQDRVDANMVLGYERSRQWAESLRVGMRGHRDFVCAIDPSYADISSRFPETQPDPFTLPDWLPPVPPPVILQDNIPSAVPFTVGRGSVSAGVSFVSQVTSGFASMGLDSTVRMTTTRAPPVATSSPGQSRYGVRTTQSLGADFTEASSSGHFSSYIDSDYDFDFGGHGW